MKKIVGLLMIKWITLEIWRKLFLAPRNVHAQVGINLWHVRVTEASLFASTPFFYCPITFPKENLKIEIEYFFRVSIARFLGLVFHVYPKLWKGQNPLSCYTP